MIWNAAQTDRRLPEREHMVAEQLAARGIRDERVLDVMRRIPRELFVPATISAAAYADAALPIECAQTISQPYMVARMTELLDPRPNATILEIGTGSGYQTAVLAALVANVYTVEWHLHLMTQAAERLAALGLENVSFRCGDGSLGWPEHAPYDGILVAAGAPATPRPLCAQLGVGGRLVVPVGPEGEQGLQVIWRAEEGFRETEVMKCRFVPLRGEAGWRDSGPSM